MWLFLCHGGCGCGCGCLFVVLLLWKDIAKSQPITVCVCVLCVYVVCVYVARPLWPGERDCGWFMTAAVLRVFGAGATTDGL